jgi:hypothetical protein
MNDTHIVNAILDLARDEGATRPIFTDCEPGIVIIVDQDSGITYRVELREF